MKRTILITAALAMLGCNDMNLGQGPSTAGPDRKTPTGDATYMAKSAVKPDDGAADSSTAVEAALAMSDRHAKVTEELLQAHKQRQELEETNKKLSLQVAKLQNDADSAQKELAEANQMLIEMRRELDRWKADVLGFRDEMRASQKAQIDALRKVLVLLGADASAPGGASAASAPAAAPAAATAPVATTQPATTPAVAGVTK